MSKYDYQLPHHEVYLLEAADLEEIRTDVEAQRILNPTRARKISQAFMPEAAGTIVLSRRANGDLYVVDGQHRVHAAKLVGVTKLPAEVHVGLTRAQEATLFLMKNRESVKPRPSDEYRIGLVAEHKPYVDTEKIVRARGLAIADHAGINQIGAVNTVVQITEGYGPEILGRVLDVSIAAWGRSEKTWDASLLGSLGRFIGRHPQIDDDAFALKIGRSAPLVWIGRVDQAAGGSQGGGRIYAGCRLFITAWNSGRKKGRVPLYDGDGTEDE